MKLSAESHSLIEQTLQEALTSFPQERMVVTDIHIQPKNDSGELIIYNDDDAELAHAIIEEWAENNCTDDQFYTDVEAQLKSLLKKWQEEGALDNLPVMKPYSFVLVDEDMETISDLLLMDDDTMLLNEDLLKGIDEELDEFLMKLLDE